jgi:DNA-binding NarL/FixJ family response regulator
VPRVAVAADSPLVRAGLIALLGTDAGVVLVENGVPAALRDDDEHVLLQQVVAAAAPDVVVWAPSRLDGAVLAALHDDADDADDADAPHAAIVLLADVSDAATALRVLRAGVRAVLAIDADPEEIMATVHAAAAGLVTLSPSLAAELFGAPRGSVGSRVLDAPPAPLTPREREVLALLAAGLPNKAIAPRLDISEHTVKTHVAAIYQKLGAGNRAEAVVAAARQGLLLL